MPLLTLRHRESGTSVVVDANPAPVGVDATVTIRLRDGRIRNRFRAKQAPVGNVVDVIDTLRKDFGGSEWIEGEL